MTLIELMLAVSLFSFLMGSVGTLVHWGLQIGATWGDRLRPYQMLEEALRQLEDDVEAARPLFAAHFTGTGTRLEFARVSPVDTAQGRAMQWVRVVYRLDGAGLVREAFRWSDPPDSAQPVDHRMVAPAAGGRFAFGARDQTGSFAWVSSWDGAHAGIPRFVQLEGAVAAVGAAPSVPFRRVFRNPAGTVAVVQAP